MRNHIKVIIFVMLVSTIPGSIITQDVNHNILKNAAVVSLENQEEIHYLKVGNGSKNLILIHGLASNYKAWLKLFPLIEDEFTIYAIDIPKYLNYTQPSGEISISHYAHLVQLFIEKLKITNPIIAGHSMGGQIAINVALKNPQIPEKLILLAPAGIEIFTEAEKTWFKNIMTVDFYLSQNKAAIKNNFDINFYGNELPDDAQFMLTERYEIMQDQDKYERYATYVVSSIHAMLDEPVFENLGEIEIPTLILFGENDALIPNKILHKDLSTAEVLQLAEENIPNSQTAMLEECGHFIQWDQPNILSDKIIKFTH